MHVDHVRDRNGLLLRRVELGVGRGDDSLRAARVRGRPDTADCWILPSAFCVDVDDGVGVGVGELGGDEVF